MEIISKFEMRFLIIVVATFIALLSCNDKKGDSTPKKFRGINLESVVNDSLVNLNTSDSTGIVITLPYNLNAEIRLSSLIDSVWYLKLENHPEAVIGQIDKMEIYDGKIFIFDSQSSSLYVFSKEGKYLFNINKLGKGPGEFAHLWTFSLNRYKNEMLIFDDKLSKTLYYDLEGKWLGESRVGFRFSDFAFINDSLTAVYTGRSYNNHLPAIKNHQMVYVDNDWKVLGRSSEFNAAKQRGIWYAGTVFREYDHQLLSFTPFTDTVYSIIGLDAHPKYIIDFGKRRLPENFDFNIDLKTFHEQYSDSEYAYMVSNVIDLKGSVYLQVNYQRSFVYGFYSKNSGAFYFGNKINNDNNHLGFQAPINFNYEDNILISYYDAYSIAQNKEEIKRVKTIDKSILALIEDVETNDNPILVFYKLKDF